MSQKNETKVLVLSLAVTLALVAISIWWFKNNIGKSSETASQSSSGATTSTELKASNQQVQERISAGDKVLISSDATPEKQAGVKAIALGNYSEAVSKLEAALISDRNDPEALIYLNNARN